jgi:hypothetical protein
MQRNIFNLSDFSISSYDSNESAEYDLITEYMLNNNLASQIHNDVVREDLKKCIKKIGVGGRTLNIGDFCCKA